MRDVANARPNDPAESRLRRSLRGLALGLSARLHRDQRGTMSIVSVFSIMLLAMLLGMVTNVAYQVDGKVKMQNASDAATYSGGIVIARGMNTLAFMNHLLCDVFATTAILREGRDRNAQSLTSDIFSAWQAVGPKFSQAPIPKLAALGPALMQKVPMEQQMVNNYSDWIGSMSESVLPTWEMILAQELIPQFERALTAATPRLSQLAANEITREHGLLYTANGSSASPRGTMQAALWRTSGQVIGGEGEQTLRTLPVVDPEMDQSANQAAYMQAAKQQRDHVAHSYLRQWNGQMMSAFDSLAKMSQFGVLWRGFTCGQLNKLLNQDYPTTNLPFQLRAANGPQDNNYLEQDYHFVGVAYWPKVPEILPGLFSNPDPSTSQTFSEILLYVPRNRLVWGYTSNTTSNPGISIGGVPGNISTLPGSGGPPTNNGGGGNNTQQVVRQGKDTHWSLMNQSWTVKLVPAVSTNIPVILSTPPPAFNQNSQQPQVPSLGQGTDVNWSLIYNH